MAALASLLACGSCSLRAGCGMCCADGPLCQVKVPSSWQKLPVPAAVPVSKALKRPAAAATGDAAGPADACAGGSSRISTCCCGGTSLPSLLPLLLLLPSMPAGPLAAGADALGRLPGLPAATRVLRTALLPGGAPADCRHTGCGRRDHGRAPRSALLARRSSATSACCTCRCHAGRRAAPAALLPVSPGRRRHQQQHQVLLLLLLLLWQPVVVTTHLLPRCRWCQSSGCCCHCRRAVLLLQRPAVMPLLLRWAAAPAAGAGAAGRGVDTAWEGCAGCQLQRQACRLRCLVNCLQHLCDQMLRCCVEVASLLVVGVGHLEGGRRGMPDRHD
jgi:hypothetical protein